MEITGSRQRAGTNGIFAKQKLFKFEKTGEREVEELVRLTDAKKRLHLKNRLGKVDMNRQQGRVRLLGV